MKHEIIGPCTPQEKDELRAILEGMGEKVECAISWGIKPERFTSVSFFLDFGDDWGTSSNEPTISFEDFKDKYAK
jgi:hypothetical protein